MCKFTYLLTYLLLLLLSVRPSVLDKSIVGWISQSSLALNEGISLECLLDPQGLACLHQALGEEHLWMIRPSGSRADTETVNSSIVVYFTVLWNWLKSKTCSWFTVEIAAFEWIWRFLLLLVLNKLIISDLISSNESPSPSEPHDQQASRTIPVLITRVWGCVSRWSLQLVALLPSVNTKCCCLHSESSVH